MKTRAEFLGHPIHQMVIVFPLGLLATATTFDVIGARTRNRNLLRASHYMVSTGLLTAVGAAIPGAIDFFSIPANTRAKKIGLLHGIGNLIVAGLFTASWAQRRRRPARPTRAAIALSVTGTALALVTEWLGGELVDRLGVGVHEEADVNAPNSLTGQPPRKPAAGESLPMGWPEQTRLPGASS
jgi:uncharacterized membrane protein